MNKTLFLFVWLFFSLGVHGSGKVSKLLIEKIALEKRIPVKLLKSIAYVESGFHSWTLNVEGQPYFFSTRQAAERFLETVLKKGGRNVDIGCVQVNWRWHGEKFKNPKELLSPEISLLKNNEDEKRKDTLWYD